MIVDCLTAAFSRPIVVLRNSEVRMRRIAVVSVVILCMGVVSAGAQEEAMISHADFAVMLLRAGAGFTGEVEDPEAALESAKSLGLVPETWEADTPLTHGELAEVLLQMGVSYVPANADSPVSEAFAAALLRRELSRLRDYLARRLGHGFSVNHVLDAGVDRAVSPSTFD